MSKALVEAGHLDSGIRLSLALSQFEADLSSDQKAEIRSYRSQRDNSPPDTNDVMRLTAEIDLHGKAGSRCFGPRLTNVLHTIQQFAALGDVVVGGSQNMIACSIWSLVRMSLLSVVKFSSYFDSLSSILMGIGRSAPRYQEISVLYDSSKILRLYLHEYLIVVVNLCHHVVKFAQKSKLVQFLSTQVDPNVKSFELGLEQCAVKIHQEVHLLTAKTVEDESHKNSKFRALLTKENTLRLAQRKMKADLHILNLCSKYDYETAWKQVRKIGKSTLFTESPEYLTWKRQACTTANTLIYTGKLGSGKSVLLANIVDDLHLNCWRKSVVVAFFFCRYDLPESLQARNIIGSLAKQLLLSVPNFATVGERIREVPTSLDLDDITRLLQDTIPIDHQAYFVLDGLDECNVDEREAVLGALQTLQKNLNLSLCISARSAPTDVFDSYQGKLKAPTTVRIPDNNPDIDSFIELKIQECLQFDKLKLGDPRLILDIRQCLMEKSQGMFLWVALQIESLCELQTDESIRAALDDIPNDLTETFFRILSKSAKKGKQFQTRILELTAVAYRPLTTDEMREALSVVSGDYTWNQSRMLTDVRSALASCGSLIFIDEEDHSVRLIHHSVKLFLLYEIERISSGVITMSNADKTMAEIIATYLNYNVFETQVSKMVVPEVTPGSAISKIVGSTVSNKHIKNTALKLLKSRRQNDWNISKTLAQNNYANVSSLHTEHYFYQYAKLHWRHHIIQVREPDTTLLNLVSRWLRKNGLEINGIDEKGQTFLSRAAAAGNYSMVELLLIIEGTDIKTRDISGLTPLEVAAMGGQTSIMEQLIRAGKDLDLDLTDPNNTIAACSGYLTREVLWAAKNGQPTLTKLILHTHAVDLACCNDSGLSLAMLAAQNHDLDLIAFSPTSFELLLLKVRSLPHVRNYALLNGQIRETMEWAIEERKLNVLQLILESDIINDIFSIDYGYSGLLLAIKQNHKDLIEMLIINLQYSDCWASLRSGQMPLLITATELCSDIGVAMLLRWDTKLSPNCTDIDDRTPLSIAAWNGYSKVVRVLLDAGAHVDLKDADRRTPLSLAAQNGHMKVVRMLREAGADMNTTDFEGQTPFSYAKKNGHHGVASELRIAGAQPGSGKALSRISFRFNT